MLNELSPLARSWLGVQLSSSLLTSFHRMMPTFLPSGPSPAPFARSW